jgi:hypothetical protein
MSELTYYVALPFVGGDDGIAAGEPTECFTAHLLLEFDLEQGHSGLAVNPGKVLVRPFCFLRHPEPFTAVAGRMNGGGDAHHSRRPARAG